MKWGGDLLATRAAGVEDLNGEEAGALGDTVGGATDGTGYVSAVTVAISVIAVISIVGEPLGAALEVLDFVY